jgi:hypothetical protein
VIFLIALCLQVLSCSATTVSLEKLCARMHMVAERMEIKARLLEESTLVAMKPLQAAYPQYTAAILEVACILRDLFKADKILAEGAEVMRDWKQSKARVKCSDLPGFKRYYNNFMVFHEHAERFTTAMRLVEALQVQVNQEIKVLQSKGMTGIEPIPLVAFNTSWA